MIIVASEQGPKLLCNPDSCAFRTIKEELNAVY